MDEPYRIEVLHIVNPHVIFIESQAAIDVPVIQQVGIYGVLPVNKTINIDGEVVPESCENWPISANTTVKEFLGVHTNVYFVPIQVEERSTIFDENIIQFGDIIIKADKKRSLIDHLVKVAAAEKDEATFHQKLTSGSLKTKLNSLRTEEVLNAIKRYYQKQKKVAHDWQKTIDKQTSIYHETKRVTTELTEANLRLFDRNTHHVPNLMKTIERKEKDFNLCKDAELVSIGCGIRRDRASHTNSANSSKHTKDSNLHEVLHNVKKYIDANCRTKVTSDCDNFEQHSDDFVVVQKSTPLKDKYSNLDNDKNHVKNQRPLKKHSNKYQENIFQHCNEQDNVPKPQMKYNIEQRSHQTLYDSNEEDNSSEKYDYYKNNQPDGKMQQNNSSKEFVDWNRNYKNNKQRNSSEIPEQSYSQKSSQDDSVTVPQHTKSTIDVLKPRERRYVYCPDMELSHENTKNFVPITVLEECATNYSKTTQAKEEDVRVSSTNIKITEKNTQNSNLNQQPTDSISQSATNIDTDRGKRDSKLVSSILRRKLQALKEAQKRQDNSFSSHSDTSVKDTSSSGEQSKLDLETSNKQCDTSEIQLKMSNKQLDKSQKQIKISDNRLEKSQKLLEMSNKQLEKSQKQLEMSNQPLQNSHKQPQIDKQLEKSHKQSEINKQLEKSHNQLEKSLKRLEISNKQLEKSHKQLEISDQQLETSKNETELPKIEPVQPKLAENILKVERNVNPFKNLDGSKSVFVDKLISPILMVHTKNDNLILPQCDLRDIPFKQDIHIMLRNMRVNKPKRLQTVTWTSVLRGHSVFMIGPASNGKTLGYVPAVCNLVIDSSPNMEGVGPICIIVCATALSVSEVESYCQRFLSHNETIVTFFSGIDQGKVTTALLNGCHVLICTAPALVTLLEVDFGVDLRRLSILVFDDCERLSQVYASEVNIILHYVKKMLKNRADKSVKVQYMVASRQWCDFMTPLAKKAPDTVIAIGAFQECVLYSKTKTSVNFVKNQTSKVNSVVEFLSEIDQTKRTVIVCRDDDEVVTLEKTLLKLKHIVFACNSTMTLHELYKLNETWANYQEPVLGPILICCDGNLTHLNITNANYLVHFSLPALFSLFCKRFSVLNENYASIFAEENQNVKIKILIDETNVEQLPKILHFVKRCTKEPLPMLDKVLLDVLREKDFKKAENLKPICNTLMMLGECIDVLTCSDRHTVFKEFDEPPHWIPKQGIITFKIIHYDSAVTYSARLLARITKNGTVKYPNNFNTLFLKMGMHFSKESNRKLQGIPKVGDICAVAIKQNFFERCKIMRILPSDNKKTTHVLVNLIDEEQLMVTKDVHLYHLPDEFKAIETHVVKVRLANIQPKNKDVTFSLAAQDYLQKTTYGDPDDIVYMRGKVVMTIGNCIFFDTAEACIDLSSVGETVVKRDFKKDLLMHHAEPNPEHIQKLKKIAENIITVGIENEPNVTPKVVKRSNWAHLDKEDFSTVILASANDASTVFLRHSKFQKVMNLLMKDIEDYVVKAPNLPREEIYAGNIVIAEFPDDKMYERARIEKIIDDKTVYCFFVDNGDWRQVSIENLKPITENIMNRIPFQAIECRLVGVKPPGNADDWPEFTTNWLHDNCFEDSEGNTKYLFVKYFTKEKATVTDGHKYGVVLFDTNSKEDVIINKMMIELNLAKEVEEETEYIDEPLDLKRLTDNTDSNEDDSSELNRSDPIVNDLVPFQHKESHEQSVPLNIILGKPIRSVPLVNDSDSDCSDKWDVNVDKNMIGIFGQPSQTITEIKSDEKLNNADSDIANKEANAVENVQKTRINDDIAKQMLKLINVESQSDSDDTDIGNERVKALDVFKNKLCNNENTTITLNELGITKLEENFVKCNTKLKMEQSRNETLDSDDLSSSVTENQTHESLNTNNAKCTEAEPPRKPKIVWRQTKNTVTMKIILIGVKDYVLEIKERYLKFETWHNDITYEFDFELYGVILPKKSVHSNKGQYIQVKLVKMLHRNWLNLTKDCSAKKWIVYDVDAIDFSSDDDDYDDHNDDARKVIKHNHEKQDTASEDEDFNDDMNFRYKRH